MNREEAAEFTRKLLARAEINAFPKTPKTINNIPVFYFEAVLSALRGPHPDPITGLVPCGCGGKAVDNEGIDYGYGYKCQKCGIATMAGSNRDCAKGDWNTAMGWKGGAE